MAVNLEDVSRQNVEEGGCSKDWEEDSRTRMHAATKHKELSGSPMRGHLTLL